MSKEPVGSVGEEAAKLFAVLQQAAGDARDGHRHTDPETDPPAAETDPPAAETDPLAADAPPGEAQAEDLGTATGHGPECQWCPVCQLIAKVRNTSPETVEQLATVAAGVLGSVRSLVEAAAESARQARAEAEARAARTSSDPDPRSTSHDATHPGWHEGAGPAWPEDGRPTRPGADRIDVSEDPEPWD